MFIIATANKEFQLTAVKFVPVSKVTMLNVRSAVKVPVTNNTENVYADIRQKVILCSKEAKLPREFLSQNDRERKNNAVKYEKSTRL